MLALNAGVMWIGVLRQWVIYLHFQHYFLKRTSSKLLKGKWSLHVSEELNLEEENDKGCLSLPPPL